MFFFFFPNQHRWGHRVVRAPVFRGVADSMKKFVLICPLGKSSWGNIMDSAADVLLCLHAWNWGWALWSKWKRTTEVCRAGELKLYSESKSETHLRIFPGSPAESTLCDQRHGNTTARRLDPSLSWHSLRPFGISSGNTLSQCQQWQTTSACMFPLTEFIFIPTRLSSACSFTAYRIPFWMQMS